MKFKLSKPLQLTADKTVNEVEVRDLDLATVDKINELPFTFTAAPGETVKIPTGVRVKIDEGWVLGIYPRSSLGFKYRLTLNNTVGIIDSDYYGAENEGHIFIKMTNCGDIPLKVEAGGAFAQGIFTPYGITYDDDAATLRTGGLGSTDKK